MDTDESIMIESNPKIDRTVVEDFDRLQRSLGDLRRTKKGADYRLTHPLATSISLARGSARTRANKALDTNT